MHSNSSTPVYPLDHENLGGHQGTHSAVTNATVLPLLPITVSVESGISKNSSRLQPLPREWGCISATIISYRIEVYIPVSETTSIPNILRALLRQFVVLSRIMRGHYKQPSGVKRIRYFASLYLFSDSLLILSSNKSSEPQFCVVSCVCHTLVVSGTPQRTLKMFGRITLRLPIPQKWFLFGTPNLGLLFKSLIHKTEALIQPVISDHYFPFRSQS